MFISDGPNSRQLRPAYDLSNYTIVLSRENRCRFELQPIDDFLGLLPVRFEVVSVEERARWFKVLNYLTKQNQTIDQFGNELAKANV